MAQYRPNEFCFINLIGHGDGFYQISTPYSYPSYTRNDHDCINLKRGLNRKYLDLHQAHFQPGTEAQFHPVKALSFCWASSEMLNQQVLFQN
jgi:hypothetical protein